MKIKTVYAFRIYDFDDDGILGHDDVRRVIDRIVGDTDGHLTLADVNRVIDKILKEADTDEDGSICFHEFERAMSKAGDFYYTFRMFI